VKPRIDDRIERALLAGQEGQALLAQGRVNDGIARLRESIALCPMFETQLLFARALRDSGQPGAADAFRAAIALDPNRPQGHNGLGLTLRAAGDRDGAIAALARAVELDASNASARFNLAATLADAGRYHEAATHFRAVVAASPDDAEAQNALGAALERIGDGDAAIACYRAAGRLPVARYNLGRALTARAALGEAETVLRELVQSEQSDGDACDAHDALARVLSLQGRAADAVAEYRRALGHAPERAEVHSNLLLAMQYDPPGVDELFAEHLAWSKRHAPATSPPPPPPSTRPLLRVGFLSADLRSHSVAYFMAPVLQGLRAAVELFAYSSSRLHDEVSDELRSMCSTWREVAELDDVALAAQIQSDELDVLVDLSGHSGGNRLRALAGHPARVVATYLGYPDTTGMSAVDFRITDALADPPGAERMHSERLIRLDGGFLCYRADRDASEPSEPPCASRGHVTFGSFNTTAKIGEASIALWARVLIATEGRLLLKSPGFDDRDTRERFLLRFARAGIAAERIELVGFAQTAREHLGAYAAVDVALDTFPYNGTTTSCEAMWMGVPVITRVGDRHASRVGLSLLSRLDLSELAAHDDESFVRIARDLASDPGRIGELRRTLRARVAASSLCDQDRIARELLAAFRGMTGSTPAN
jgi:predicted O-linked N-acetylglucosamine transferase (SPINDLY family)